MTPDREKLALEAAREAIARKKDADDAAGAAALIRAGKWDDVSEVANAIAGAREALALLAETAPSGEAEPVAIELSEETDYWAVQSPSGVHIGMWNEIGHAANAAAEVDGSSMIPLRVVAPTPSASEDRAGEPENAQNVADALRACDWSNVPIGNKAIIAHAADLLSALSARDETIARLTRERDEALDRIEELERHAESVSAEFEKELWLEVKALLNECHFDWNFVDGDGLLAAEAVQHIRETLTALEEGGKRSAARAEAAEARLAVMGVGVVGEIGAERRRQMSAEGWTLEHDDDHDGAEMARAACCYADPLNEERENPPIKWPWDARWWKPKDRRRDLIRAGALIVAEIERLDRTRAALGQEERAG